MKKIILSILTIVLCVSLFASCNNQVKYNEEIVKNGKFEEGSFDWKSYADSNMHIDFNEAVEGSDQDIQQGELLGKKQLSIKSKYDAGYGYYKQEVNVVKNAIYKLEIRINISSTIKGKDKSSDGEVGAYVSFVENNGVKFINKIQPTDGFELNTVYFKSLNKTKLNLLVGVGDKDTPAKGDALFDTVSIVRVEKAPENVLIKEVGSRSEVDRSNTQGNAYVIALSILTVLCCVGAYLLIKKAIKYSDTDILDGITGGKTILSFIKSPLFLMISILSLTFIIRLIIVNFVYGATDYMDNLSHYAFSIIGKGPQALVSNYPNANLSPGMAYILTIIGVFTKILPLHDATTGMSIFLKIPPLICDVIGVYLVYNLASKHFNYYVSTIIAGLYALLPVVFTFSSAWGSYMSVTALFVLLTVTAMLNKKSVSTIIYYTIAVMMNYQALIILPLVAAYMIDLFVTNYAERKNILITGAIAFIATITLVLPFSIKLSGADKVFYMYSIYLKQIFEGAVYSANSFNFYALFGLVGTETNTFAQFLSVLIYAVLAAYAIFVYFYKKNRAELLLLGSFLFASVYTFATNVSPIIMVFSLLLMIAYIGISGDKRIYWIFAGFAFITFVNIGQLMNICGYITNNTANSLATNFVNGNALTIIFSVATIVLTLYFAYITYDISYNDNILEINQFEDLLKVKKKKNKKRLIFK